MKTNHAKDDASASHDKPLSILVAERLGVTILTPQGSVEYHHLGDFRERLSALIDSGCARLVVDMLHSRYMCSTTIGVLIGQKSNAAKRNGDLRLCRVSPGLWRMFSILGVDSIFQCYKSVDEAVKSYQ